MPLGGMARSSAFDTIEMMHRVATQVMPYLT
jgi:hypothetical protein